MYKKWTTTPQTDVIFLKDMGLLPTHKVLDVGCGGGRLGFELINYLDVGNYFAFDKETNWIQMFKNSITGAGMYDKNPTVLLSDFDFDFDESIKFDYVYAYSVFTHVGPDLVKQCLNNLKKNMTSESKFYATIIAGSSSGFDYNRKHPERSGEYLQARYDLEYFNELIEPCGYTSELISEDYKQRVGPGNHEDANLSEIHKIILITLT